MRRPSVSARVTALHDHQAGAVAGILAIEELDQNLYRSGAELTPESDERQTGGRVLAQALIAAGRTTDGRLAPRSLRATHVRPPDPSRSTVFEVARDRDARGFVARRVVALQDGRVVLSLAASFDGTGLVVVQRCHSS